MNKMAFLVSFLIVIAFMANPVHAMNEIRHITEEFQPSENITSTIPNKTIMLKDWHTDQWKPALIGNRNVEVFQSIGLAQHNSYIGPAFLASNGNITITSIPAGSVVIEGAVHTELTAKEKCLQDFLDSHGQKWDDVKDRYLKGSNRQKPLPTPPAEKQKILPASVKKSKKNWDSFSTFGSGLSIGLGVGIIGASCVFKYMKR